MSTALSGSWEVQYDKPSGQNLYVSGGTIVKDSEVDFSDFTIGGKDTQLTVASSATVSDLKRLPSTDDNSIISIVNNGGTIERSTLYNVSSIINDGELIADYFVSSIVVANGANIASTDFSNSKINLNQSFMSGGTVDDNSILNVGSNSYLAGTKIDYSASAFVSSGGNVRDVTVTSSGELTLLSGATIAGRVNVRNGGTLVMNGTAGNGAIWMRHGNLVISGTDMPTNVISNWSEHDTISFPSIQAADITNVETSDSGVNLTTKSGKVYHLSITAADKLGYELVTNKDGSLSYTTCFAEGTLILTPNGEISVENLNPGDLIKTPKGDMPIKWVGYRNLVVENQPNPEDNWLVRICKNAISEGVPSRDLLVTQEHCMVFEGKLIPARMLVNDISIIKDRSIPVYNYYHIELNTHEAIWAENTLTESYLDTGNRDQFTNNTVTSLFLKLKNNSENNDLILDTSRAFVEKVYNDIFSRTEKKIKSKELTHEPDLRLVTDKGQIIRAKNNINNSYMFNIPKNTSFVRLVSRYCRHSDAIGSFIDDRRNLGVLVKNITIANKSKIHSITSHLSKQDQEGWNGWENSQCRWTDGNALLETKDMTNDEFNILKIEVIAAGPYLSESNVTEKLSVC